jgi:hypothetical protein
MSNLDQTDLSRGPTRYVPVALMGALTRSQAFVPGQGTALSAFSNPDDEVARTFQRLERKWKRDTQFLSSPTEKYLHPSYAAIIGLGRLAVPLVLRSLQRESDDWFYALRAMTHENPVTAAMAGDVQRMRAAWLRWGERNGVL